MTSSNLINLIGTLREQINRFILKEMKRHNIKELAATHGNILLHLFNEGMVSMKKLAEVIDRDKSTVTALIEKLLKLGYVEKSISQNDHRVVYVTITNRGKELQPLFQEISDTLAIRFVKGINKKDQSDACRILTKIRKNFF